MLNDNLGGFQVVKHSRYESRGGGGITNPSGGIDLKLVALTCSKIVFKHQYIVQVSLYTLLKARSGDASDLAGHATFFLFKIDAKTSK